MNFLDGVEQIDYRRRVTVTTVGAVTVVGSGPGKGTDTLGRPGGRVDCPKT